MSLMSASELGEWGEGDTAAVLVMPCLEAGCVGEPAITALAGAARIGSHKRPTPGGVTLTLFL